MVNTIRESAWYVDLMAMVPGPQTSLISPRVSFNLHNLDPKERHTLGKQSILFPAVFLYKHIWKHLCFYADELRKKLGAKELQYFS